MLAGDQLFDGDGRTAFLCLHPREGGFYKDRNASSLVLKLSVEGKQRLTYPTAPDGQENKPGFTALLTGDVEEEGELQMLEEDRELLENCDILKTAHHGSATSSAEAFLDAPCPDFLREKQYLRTSAQRGAPALCGTRNSRAYHQRQRCRYNKGKK